MKKPNGHLQKGYTVSLILAMEVIYSNVEFATVLFCAIILNFRIKKQSNSYLGQLVFISYPEKKAEINSYIFVYKLTNSLIRIPYN